MNKKQLIYRECLFLMTTISSNTTSYFYLWRFDLYQRSSSEEVCLHHLLPVLATVVFILVFRYVKVIKIHQDFPELDYKCTATFFMVHSVVLCNKEKHSSTIELHVQNELLKSWNYNIHNYNYTQYELSLSHFNCTHFTDSHLRILKIFLYTLFQHTLSLLK